MADFRETSQDTTSGVKKKGKHKIISGRFHVNWLKNLTFGDVCHSAVSGNTFNQ